MVSPSITVEGEGSDDVAAALHAAGLVRAAHGTPPQVRVVIGDLEDIARVAGEDVPALVLAVVEQVDRRSATALLDRGADGIALTSDPSESLAVAVRALLAGYLVIPAAGRHALRRPVLTTRQKQVLGLVVLGLGNADIAQRLFLSEATVKMHLTAAFSQLGVRSRKEAIDVILDPAANLGTGILSIAEPRETQSGYGSPTVS